MSSCYFVTVVHCTKLETARTLYVAVPLFANDSLKMLATPRSTTKEVTLGEVYLRFGLETLMRCALKSVHFV